MWVGEPQRSVSAMIKPRPIRSGDWCDEGPETAREFHKEDKSTFTGLYDQHGSQLHREPEPFGFNPDRWNMKKTKKSGKRKGC